MGGTKKFAKELEKYRTAIEIEPRFPKIGTIKLDDVLTPIRQKAIPNPNVTTFDIEVSLFLVDTCDVVDITNKTILYNSGSCQFPYLLT